MQPLYTQHKNLSLQEIKKQLNIFCKEDKVHQDLTTIFTTKKHNPPITAHLIAEEPLIISGLPLLDVIFEPFGLVKNKDEGDGCSKGEVICQITAPAATLLSYERILLNLIQRMSGITSLTNKYVKTLNSPKIKILDTRKTTPGLRLFEKYAVCLGGGYNHRFDLNEGVMFKDNHLTLINNLDLRLKDLKNTHPTTKLQIEVDTYQQLELILNSTSVMVDAFLLDNMHEQETAHCIKLIRQKLPKCFIESSGGITFETIANYTKLDLDGISIGALTHQATSKNIKLEFQPYDKS